MIRLVSLRRFAFVIFAMVSQFAASDSFAQVPAVPAGRGQIVQRAVEVEADVQDDELLSLVDYLVTQLGADRFATRQWASAQLSSMLSNRELRGAVSKRITYLYPTIEDLEILRRIDELFAAGAPVAAVE